MKTSSIFVWLKVDISLPVFSEEGIGDRFLGQDTSLDVHRAIKV